MRKLAIAIPTHNRPHYTRKVLDALDRCNPALKDQFAVFFSCEPDGAQVSQIEDWNTDYFWTISINPEPLGCIQNTYKAASSAFASGADFVVYLEDDTVPSPDLLDLALFYSKQPEDPRVMCYSFYRLSGDDNDARKLRTFSWFAPWGFAISRIQWESYFRGVWPTGWDTKMLAYLQEEGLVSIYPALSRIKNIGETGLNYNPGLYRAHGFADMPVAEEIPSHYLIEYFSS